MEYNFALLNGLRFIVLFFLLCHIFDVFDDKLGAKRPVTLSKGNSALLCFLRICRDRGNGADYPNMSPFSKAKEHASINNVCF